MGRVRTCYDNAGAESFFATLKKDLINRYRWPTHPDAQHAIFDFIERWYNNERLHSTLDPRLSITSRVRAAVTDGSMKNRVRQTGRIPVWPAIHPEESRCRDARGALWARARARRSSPLTTTNPCA